MSASAISLRSVGDRIAPGDYRLHSQFRRALNFRCGARLVSVVDPEVGAGPLNIVLSGWDQDVRTLRIKAGTVSLGSREFRFGETYDSALPVAGHDRGRFRENLERFRALLAAAAPASSLAFLLDQRRETALASGFQRTFAARVAAGVRQIFAGDLLAGVRALKGCGVGLTPSGDDFLAGLLIGLNLLAQMHAADLREPIAAIGAAARGDNLFSNAALEMAQAGRVFARMKDLIAALMEGHATAVGGCAGRLFAIGGSSGADLGTGFYMTVQNDVMAVARWRECAAEVLA